MKTNKNKTSKSKRFAFLAKILALVASACVAVAVFTACDLTDITNSVVSQTETPTKGTQTQTDAVVPEKNLAANKTTGNGATTTETLPVENDQAMPPMNENGATPTDGQPPMNGRFSPDGQFPTDGQTPPEMPNGEQPMGGQTPPNGQTIPNGQTPPEISIEGATV